jgi:Domain of unknown function DUF1828
MDYRHLLIESFCQNVSTQEKSSGITKLSIPVFHDDGDMMDIFLQDVGQGKIRISDEGLTLIRLSRDFDMDIDNKNNKFLQILLENKVQNEGGNLFIDVDPDALYAGVMHFSQVIRKISSLSFV